MTNEIKPIQTKNEIAIIKPDQQVAMIKVWTEDFDKLTKTQAFALTPEQRNFGVSLITGLVGRCAKEQIDISKLDMTNFFEQTKHYAKLQLSFQEGEIYIDTRNNKNTGKIDIAVRKQYQGIMKLASRWIRKDMKIVDWTDRIVCTGDTFSYDFDFSTGEYKINYKENTNVDHTNLNNITHAIAIAYIEIDGRPKKPYICIIDKKRIMRAFNASSAKDKGPWSSDPARMVRKTAYWCLYNDSLKHFVDIPADMQASFAETEDEMDFTNLGDDTTPVDNNVYDLPIEIVEEDEDDNTDEDFEEYLRSTEEKEVFYSEYKNNTDKYNLVEGSYDAKKKTCRVTLK